MLQDQKQDFYPTSQYLEPYKLRIGDEIAYTLLTVNDEIQSLYNVGMNLTAIGSLSPFVIFDDGCVALPTLGRVKLVDLTIKEAESLLSQEFKKITSDAQVRIVLCNDYYFVLGDNGKGKFYLYKDNLTIFQALAQIGEISFIADLRKVKIIRKDAQGNDVVKDVDLTKASIINDEFYYLLPNDVLYIPNNSKAFFRINSVSAFLGTFIAPISLFIIVLSLF
ncbi:hypothetical protein AwDysgo_04750 [Bacteroidales bacterium]|nr:hypothetical protein AwDysgo_04750 [Bacteroidales bacterium]